MDLRMYILVNEDVKIEKGKLAGQIGHAVMGYIGDCYEAGPECMAFIQEHYMDTIQKKIILKCPQSKLEELEDNGEVTVVRDKGYTQLEPNTLTCVNIGIYDKEDVPEWVQKLKLLR